MNGQPHPVDDGVRLVLEGFERGLRKASRNTASIERVGGLSPRAVGEGDPLVFHLCLATAGLVDAFEDLLLPAECAAPARC